MTCIGKLQNKRTSSEDSSNQILCSSYPGKTLFSASASPALDKDHPLQKRITSPGQYILHGKRVYETMLISCQKYSILKNRIFCMWYYILWICYGYLVLLKCLLYMVNLSFKQIRIKIGRFFLIYFYF